MKKVQMKTHNLKAISRYSLTINITILLILSVILSYALPSSDRLIQRTTPALNIVSGIILICFMVSLEKYSSLLLGLQEKIVINTLSVIYTLIIMSFINLVLFMSKERLFADIIMAAISLAALTVSDNILERIVRSDRLRRTPNLLILNSDDTTFARTKRIKYGSLSAYNAWYESIDDKSGESFSDFCKKRFSEFDAICILDGLEEEKYNIAVKTAVELKKELFIVPNMIDAGKTNAKLVRFDDVLTLYMPKQYISDTYLILKRIMDIVLSFIGLVVAAIPMIIIAIAIKLTSPGPVFYKQERLTKDKKPFMIYKFRTMIPDAEKLTGPKFAEKDDPRVTKIGKVLRSCRLDELPQILNIFKGDMSIVGPRPERPVFAEQFEKEIESYDYRFAVKAGLTSLSHVYGRYSTYIHDRTYYDLFYITNYSLLMDIKIILLTSKTMFLKSASEGEDVFKEKTQADTPESAENISAGK